MVYKTIFCFSCPENDIKSKFALPNEAKKSAGISRTPACHQPGARTRGWNRQDANQSTATGKRLQTWFCCCLLCRYRTTTCVACCVQLCIQRGLLVSNLPRQDLELYLTNYIAVSTLSGGELPLVISHLEHFTLDTLFLTSCGRLVISDSPDSFLLHSHVLLSYGFPDNQKHFNRSAKTTQYWFYSSHYFQV